MNPSHDHAVVLKAVLRARSVGYACVDGALRIEEIGGTAPDYLGPITEGQELYEVFPELVGSEAELEALYLGSEERFELNMINREKQDGTTAYFDLMLVAPASFTAHACDSAHDDARDDGGRAPRLIAVWEDISAAGQISQKVMQQRNELTLLRDELARQNEMLRSANHELRRNNQLKSRFVGVAAHELRSPLTAMIGYSELLQDETFGPLADRQRHFTTVIENSAQRLLGLLNNLLDVTRLEAGNLELNLEPADLVELVGRAEAEVRLQVLSKQQTLTTEAVAGSVMVLCDPARALQVLVNLVGNANKYTPEGGSIRISIRTDAATGYAEVAVADTGIGIAEDEVENLFVTFFRASNANTINASGAGLGLSIAASLIEQHGGTMHVASTLGQGSTFTFTLPLAEA
jgi:signal transduction histidine kinase